METSLDPLLMIDCQGKIGELNAALEKMTGIPREQLIGTDFIHYFTEPGKAQAACIQALQDQVVQDWALEIQNSIEDFGDRGKKLSLKETISTEEKEAQYYKIAVLGSGCRL